LEVEGCLRSQLLGAAVVLASVAVLAASQEPKQSDKDNKTITVTGCLDGNYLRREDHDAVGTIYDTFRLAASKQLMKEIASKAQGHKLEVTGHVIDAPGTAHFGKTMKIGEKTTIYSGASELPALPDPTTTSTATLQVQAFRDLFETCR
jgi:hypothetical protein